MYGTFSNFALSLVLVEECLSGVMAAYCNQYWLKIGYSRDGKHEAFEKDAVRSAAIKG